MSEQSLYKGEVVMGILSKHSGSGFGEKIIGALFDNGPSVGEKIGMIFTDVETEGKKRGYVRASKEYEIAYKKIEKEFSDTKQFIEKQKDLYGNQAYQFIEYLEKLEKQKEELEKQVDLKINCASEKYNIPVGEIRKSIDGGNLLIGTPRTIDILGIIYSYKEKKLRQAEQSGYVEAKKLYETKIQKLKEELIKLKEKGDRETKTLLNQIYQLIDVITEEEMKIVELKILL